MYTIYLLILFRDGHEPLLDFVWREYVENAVRPDIGDLEVALAEVHSNDITETGNARFDHGLPVARGMCLVLEFLCQPVVGLLLFLTGRSRQIPAVVPGRVDLVHEGAFLVVVANDRHCNTKGPHICPLRVHLVDISDALRQHVARHVETMLVPELECLAASSAHERTRVSNRAVHYAAKLLAKREHVVHRVRVEQLIADLLLRHEHSRVRALQRHRRQVCRLDRLEGVLDLVQPALRRENCNMTVVSGSTHVACGTVPPP